MSEPTEPDKSREHRPRVLKGASILAGVNNSAISCTIRNMNKHGAELRVSLEARVPQQFLLYVPVDGLGYQATVRWRRQDRVGVSFSGSEPKPHWFYG